MKKLPQKKIMEQIKEDNDSMILIADLKKISKNSDLGTAVDDIVVFSNMEHQVLVEKVKSYSSRLGVNCKVKTILILND